MNNIISIHAPRVGSDVNITFVLRNPTNFNPRSPCGERLVTLANSGLELSISIHAPRVGSDPVLLAVRPIEWNFNPRSPCGERRISWTGRPTRPLFQSTLPVWGATQSRIVVKPSSKIFQSTLPVWGATSPALGSYCAVVISIHAPRVGSDTVFPVAFAPMSRFQSTLPVWGATAPISGLSVGINISIHAPRVGSDMKNKSSSFLA